MTRFENVGGIYTGKDLDWSYFRAKPFPV